MADGPKFWPFSRSRAETEADRLLAAVTQISRQPSFFGEGRIPDTLEGRFELMTVHAALALIRLRASPEAAPMAQEFTDKLFRQFDAGLREAGVGDLAVPKRMSKLAGSFYGRLEAYEAGLLDESAAALEAALARNTGAVAFAPALAQYARQTLASQAPAPLENLTRLDGWALAPG
jgi:cytochrome b pre-mRNA-processing protein 3